MLTDIVKNWLQEHLNPLAQKTTPTTPAKNWFNPPKDYSNPFVNQINQQAQPKNVFTPLAEGIQKAQESSQQYAQQFREMTPSQQWKEIGGYTKQIAQAIPKATTKFIYSATTEAQNILKTGEPSESLRVLKIFQPILGTDKITSYQRDIINNLAKIRTEDNKEPYIKSVAKASLEPIINMLFDAWITSGVLKTGAETLKSLSPSEKQVSAWATLGRPKTLAEARTNYYDLINQYRSQQILGGPQATAINNAWNILKTQGIPKVNIVNSIAGKMGQALLSSPSQTGAILTQPMAGVPEVAQTRLLPQRVGQMPTQPYQPTQPATIPIGLSTKEIPISPEVPISKEKGIIPKQLEPLAEEARKYKSAEEFFNAVTEASKQHLRGKPTPLSKAYFAWKDRPVLEKGITNFYNQVKGVKEVKPEISTQPTGLPTGLPIPPTIAPEAQKPIVETPTTEENVIPPLQNNIAQTLHEAPQTKPSKIGLDIKQFGKETGVQMGKTAQYTPITIGEEIDKAKQFIESNPEKLKTILSGAEELPPEIRGSAFIDAVRDSLNKNPNKELIKIAANSPLVSETSKIAQELKLLSETDPDSFFAKIKEVKQARIDQAAKTTKQTAPEIAKKIKETVKQNVIQKLLDKSASNSPLVVALKSGKLSVEQLASMATPERIKTLTKYLGANAVQANLEFEKKQILKHIEVGIKNWISKYGFIGRYSPEKMATIKQAITEWKENQFKRVFDAKEYGTFLEALAEKQIGASITEEEANKIYTLTKQTEELKTKWNADLNKWDTEQDRFEYGASKVLLDKYIESLKNPTEIKDIVISRINEFKATIRENPPKAIADVIGDSIRSLSDLSISLVASFDNSFIGRQGIKVLYTQPKLWAGVAKQSVVNFIKTLKSGSKVWDAILSDYYSRPNFMNGSYKIAKILPRDFERFPSALPEKVFGLGRIFKASEVAYKGSDLMMRSNLYDLISKIASNNGVDMTNPDEIKGFGIVINSLTGKGQWGRQGEGAMRLVLWAPRMLKGNIDVLTMHFGQDIPPEARKYAAKNLIKIIASIATILLIAKALDKDSVEENPVSNNFGKIMIGPNHDIPVDISGGMTSIITLAMRLITGKTKSTITGKITDLSHPKYGQPTRRDAVINFLEGKTTPMIHAIINILNNQMYGGKKPTVGGVAESLFMPISVQNLKEVSATELYRRPSALWGVILDVFGFNSSTPLRSIKYDKPILQEIKRLQEAGYDNLQTSFISGFLQENPLLSAGENKEIFDKITSLSNKKLSGLLQSEEYRKKTDEDKAKIIEGFMDKARDVVYTDFIIHKIKGLQGEQLKKKISQLKQSGILNKTRFKLLRDNGLIP